MARRMGVTFRGRSSTSPAPLPQEGVSPEVCPRPVHIDLNMVRNGVVSHSSAWRHGGYNAFQSAPKRYRLIDREQLLACCGIGSEAELVARHREWVEETMTSPRNIRQAEWTEALALSSEGFVDGVCSALGVRARGRQVRQGRDHWMLK